MSLPKKTKPMQTLPITVFAFAILLSISVPVANAAGLDASSEFRKLEQQFQQAKTKAQFTAVATGYNSLKSPATASVSVLFNQANAWFKAEEFGRAIVGYRQALRLAPGDAAIRSNLQLAIEKAGHEISPSTVIDYAFFWKNGLTGSALAMLVTIVMLIVAVLFLLNRGSSFDRIAFRILMGVAVVLIASFAIKINEEELTKHGVVVVDSSDAKKGPATSYEAAFSSPLTNGQEFTVVGQQPDWVEVDISGIGAGWLPESDVVVY